MKHNKLSYCGVFLLISILSAAASRVWAQTPDSWVQKADAAGTGVGAPAARSGSFSFALNGKGYVGGGEDGNTLMNDLWEYDPATNVWTQKANYAGGSRTGAVGFAIGNKGYAGTGGNAAATKDFYAYDPVLNTWTRKADFGGDIRYRAYGFSIGNKGYIGGGIGLSATWFGDLWEYDTTSDTWTAKASLPYGLAWASTLSIGGKGYIVGGDSLSVMKADVWCYDPSTNSFTAKATFPGGGRRAGAGFSIGNTGFICSGVGNAGTYSDLWQYYLVTDSWVQRASLPSNVYRLWAAPFAIGTKGYVVGGQGASSVTGDCLVFDTVSKAWGQAARFGAIRRTGAVGFSIGGRGYMGTGLLGSYYFQDDFWMYDTLTDSWTQKANFGGGARAYAVGFAIGDKGYIGTGVISSNRLGDFWEYDPISNTWTKKASYPAGGHASAVGFSIGDKGYLGTGAAIGLATDDWYEYDPKMDMWAAKAKFAPGQATRAIGFSIGKRGYIAAGTLNGSFSSLACWEYNPDSNSWKQKAHPGVYALDASGFSIGGRGYLVGGYDGSTSSSRCLEYDPDSNVWRSRGNFGGGSRYQAFSFSIGNKGYVGAGSVWASSTLVVQCNDFWQYTPRGIITAYDGVPICANDTLPFLVPYFSAESFSPGNTFSAQLSDSSGSFANATLLNPLPGSSPGLMKLRLPLPASNYSGYNYKLRIISDSPAMTGSSAHLIFYRPHPSVSWSNGIVNASGGYQSYQWLLNDTPIAGATSASFTPMNNGAYKVMVIDATGCQGTSDSLVVIGLSVPSQSLLQDVVCYPNPVVDEVYINGSGLYDAMLLRPDGTICVRSQNCRKLDMHRFASGIYVLQIREAATGRQARFRILKAD